MGKKKKTLKQKRLADLRHLTEPHGNTPSQQHEETHTPHPSAFSYTFTTAKPALPVKTYSLQHDLRKTLFVSTGILLFLILFSALLQSHAFVLPLVSLRY